MSNYINIEILQSIPFANANRDDAEQPKTVRIGGITRGRLSSQSLKRAARFHDASAEKGYGITGDTSGGRFYRTRYLKQLINTELEKRELVPSDYETRIDELFGKALGKSKKDKNDPIDKLETLVVLTQEEIEKLTNLIVENDVKITNKSIVEILQNSSKRDLALWGRFFANSDESTLDGSAQVAHAFTTHRVKVEDDFFVGLDDAATLYSDHAGAGHPGDSFYLNGVFYKYANVNIEETLLNIANARVEKNKLELKTNLDDIKEQVNYAVKTFLKNFTLSVPQGKIKSTAHTTLPSYIRVTITDGHPINGASAFENPVDEKNALVNSVRALEETHDTISNVFGTPSVEFVINLVDKNTDLTLVQLLDKVEEKVSEIVNSAYVAIQN